MITKMLFNINNIFYYLFLLMILCIVCYLMYKVFILENDLYVNTITGVIFQYLQYTGSPTWQEVGSITLPQYSEISTTSFTTGSTTINIPLTSITSAVSPVVGDFVIRYQISNSTSPVASSFTTAIVSTNLAITITAIQYSGGTWSNLTGSKDVHLFISYKG